MKVYIAGPMTGIPQHNFPAFDKMRDFLIQRGHTPVSPADITRNSGLQWNEDGTITRELLKALFTLDLGLLTTCDAIVLLDNWEKSRGAKIEAQIAVFMCLTFLDNRSLRPVPPPWMSVEVKAQ